MTTTRGIVCWHQEGIPRKYRIVILIVLTCRLRLTLVRAPRRNRPTPPSTAAPSLCAIGQIRERRELACAGGHLHRGHRAKDRVHTAQLVSGRQCSSGPRCQLRPALRAA